jgi:superfamily II DNA or RNA helicase
MCDISYLKLRLKNELEKNNYDHKKLFDCKISWYYFEMFSAIYHKAHMWKDVDVDRKEKLGLPTYDTGIDCATEDTAIQCKYREKCKRVSWDEVAKFLATSKLCKIPFKKSVLSLNDSTIKVSKVMSHVYNRKDMSEDDYENITEKLKRFVYKIEEKYTNLRYYQKYAVRTITNGKGDIVLKMACGTGKSLVMFYYIHKYLDLHKTSKICIFVPTLLLMRQTEEWAKKYGIVEYCLVGTGHNKRVKYDKKLYICVYNSVSYVENIFFDRIFIDEAHHIKKPYMYSADDSCDENVSKKILKMKVKKKIYMSATIDCPNYEYNMRKAINDGYICDYDITICKYDKEFSFENIAKFLIKHPCFSYILAYVNTIDNAKRFSEKLNTFDISSTWFSGETSMRNRERKIKDFEKGLYRVLVTVNTLGEGIHIKNASVCLFAEKRSSSKNVIQCIGRIQRLSEIKNKLSHVILPTCDDNTLNNFLRIMTTVDFKVAKSIKNRGSARINILNMSSCDGKLLNVDLYDSYGHYLHRGWDVNLQLLTEYINKYKKRPRDNDRNENVRRLGQWINNQCINYKKKQYNMKNKETLKKWEIFLSEYNKYIKSNEEKWDDNLNLVKNYIKMNKEFLKTKNKEEIKKLQRWMLRQKKNFSGKVLIMKCEHVRQKYIRFCDEYTKKGIKYFLNIDTFGRKNRNIKYENNDLVDDSNDLSSINVDDLLKKIDEMPEEDIFFIENYNLFMDDEENAIIESNRKK